MSEKVPKIIFKAMPLSESVDSIHGFLNPYKNEWDWSEMIYGEYPNIKDKLKGINKVGDRKAIETDFFKEYIVNNDIDLSATAKIFQHCWDKFGNEIFLVLAEILEVDWAGIPPEISAYISLNPINPRDIENFSFEVFYKYPQERVISVSIHELLHFIYFKKCRQVFPKTKERELDAPYLAWHLSEMVPAIILNDECLQKVFKYNFRSYDIYEDATLHGKSLLSYLKEFYDTRNDFEDFLKKSWDFVQENESFIQDL
ncbi:MAG: hypothetical protein WC451_01625 [Patescibacteria group bacterium]